MIIMIKIHNNRLLLRPCCPLDRRALDDAPPL